MGDVAAADAAQSQRLRIDIRGIVQGVGFRPFVYRLATDLTLCGWVANDTHGVVIEVEGCQPALLRFLARLRSDLPPQARLHSVDTAWLKPCGYGGFEIRRSNRDGTKTAWVLPDIATCDDCLREVFERADRRCGYAFTNCTNCGPRFSIIRALPYDRPHTTMHAFRMCPTCQAEYEAPTERRFHAQPNACSVCGPHLELWTPSGTRLAVGPTALRRAVEALKRGRIVSVKGLGGFHLMVDARNSDAVTRLRQRKSRPDKPFALMVRDLGQAGRVCQLTREAELYLSSPAAPILLLPRQPAAPVAQNVAPGNANLGIMLPCTPLHHLLLHLLDGPLVATSGNWSDEPICTDEREALERLGQMADLFLVHDRPIARHVDDSVARVMGQQLRLLRRARGYAPLPLTLQADLPTVLAVGAQQKNTIALSMGRQVFISQHIGDMETPQALAAFEQVIADFLRLYEASPVAIACDLHPDYAATHWAQAQAVAHDMRLIPVQHHHAHLAACLAEHGEPGPTLGVTWDGTGYGSDGSVWGGEFLYGTAADVVRVAHLRPFRLPGAEAAIREPCRTAFSLLWEIDPELALERLHLAPLHAFRPQDRNLLARLLERRINTPLTSSVGRLFDAVASLIGLSQRTTFEGQAAMSLEHIADAGVQEAYPLPMELPPVAPASRTSPLVLDWQPLVAALLIDLRRGISAAVMAARFHNALVEAIVSVARTIGTSRVALSGGCFQNRLLTERAVQRLTQAGYRVLLHRQVPPNDGGISVGQVMVAAARINSEYAPCEAALHRTRRG
jgi:hydrogenase maturation protein HypF